MASDVVLPAAEFEEIFAQTRELLLELFGMDEVKLKFDKPSLKEIASAAIERKTGARGLRSILEDVMLDIMYELPEYKNKTVTITKDVINKTKKPKVA